MNEDRPSIIRIAFVSIKEKQIYILWLARVAKRSYTKNNKYGPSSSKILPKVHLQGGSSSSGSLAGWLAAPETRTLANAFEVPGEKEDRLPFVITCL